MHMKITTDQKVKKSNSWSLKVERSDIEVLAMKANQHVSERAIKAVQELQEQEKEAQRLDNLRHRRIEPHLRTERVS